MKNSGIPFRSLPPHLQDQVAAKLAYPKKFPFKAGQTVDSSARDLPRNPYPLSLWLDYRVPSLNSILGRVRVTIKEKEKAAAAVAAALAVVPNYPRNPSGRMHVLITCYVCQPRDADNPVTKFVNDQLRYAGVLRNDDPGSMALTVNPDVKVAKRKLEGTRVVITEALP